MMLSRRVAVACGLVVVRAAAAQPAPAADEAPAPPPVTAAVEPPTLTTAVAPPPGELAGDALSRVQIHGFVSQGAFVSTANDYIGHSSRGSLELFQAGINVSTDVTERLRVGLQLFSHDEGLYGDYTPRLDWAYLDYRWRSWLGIRAGHIKIPFGLYNEYADIDASRLQILLPQSVYPIGNRDVLLAQTGVSAYGTVPLSQAGELDYQLYGGSLFVPLGAAASRAAIQTYAVDTHYLIGGQVFWHPPLDGLRVGGSVLRGDIDFHSDLPETTTALLIAVKLVPPTFNGQLTSSFRPVTLKVLSAEYSRGDWTFAAEYARWFARVESSLPSLLPTAQTHSERFYGMATYHVANRIDAGATYSVFYPNVHDRSGDDPKLAKPFYAFQRDASATLRFEVSDHWLWKLEGHVIDGVASMFDGAVLDPTLNMAPSRTWGLFLINTSVTF